MTTTAALQLRDFHLAFGRADVLRGLDLTVPEQGCTVLLGPSGTGKSALLYYLGGRLDSNAQVRVGGRACYFGEPLSVGHRPALVEQKPHLLVQSVRESLVGLWPLRCTLSRAQQSVYLAEMLSALGVSVLADALDASVIELAPHLQRMVAILRQVLAGPRLLMVDEPTAELDDASATEVLALLDRLKQDRPLLVVSHHLQHTQHLADHVALVASGRLQEANTCRAFFDHPRSDAARQFIRTGSCPEHARDVAEPEWPVVHEPRPDVVSDSPPRQVAYRSAGRGPEGFVWLLPGQLAGTPCPGAFDPQAHDLQALRDAGVTVLVSLTETPFDTEAALAYGLTTAFEPIVDGDAPTLSQAERLCRHIDAWLHSNHIVAVHCHAGLGRTGTVLAAYLLWCNRAQPHALGAAHALRQVRRLRPGMVQTSTQEHFLTEFARRIAGPVFTLPTL